MLYQYHLYTQRFEFFHNLSIGLLSGNDQIDIFSLAKQQACTLTQLTAKWHLNRSQFGITIDHDLAYFRSLIGILPVTPVTNGAIVIHTQRLKSDPGGNLLS